MLGKKYTDYFINKEHIFFVVERQLNIIEHTAVYRHMNVHKAIIDAVAFETAMFPVAAVVPSELLPVCGKPLIEYVVNEALQAGIEDIAVLIHPDKRALANYLQPTAQLKARLQLAESNPAVQELEHLWKTVQFTIIEVDPETKGTASLTNARNFIGNEPFALLGPQTIVQKHDCTSFTAQLIEAFGKYGRSVVGLLDPRAMHGHRHGYLSGNLFDTNMLNGTALTATEPQNPTSDEVAAICPRYILEPNIFNHIATTTNESNNSLVSSLQRLLKTDGLIGAHLQGECYDITDSKRLLLANLCLAEMNCG